MSVDYTVGDGEGGDKISATDVANTLTKAGYQNVTLAPDGQSIVLTDPSGEHGTLDIPSYLEQTMGGKVSSIMPSEGSVNYDNVDAALRAKMSVLPNDNNLRSIYLKGALQDKGIKDAKIVGSGDDFHYFNPETGKYYALTNKPGFDFSDAAGFVPKAASFVAGTGGSIAGALGGGSLGAAAGPVGAIAGGAAGAGLGGTAGRGLVQAIGGAFDPRLREALLSEENLKDAAVQGGTDALFGGLTSAPVLQGLMKTGIGSNITKLGGRAVEGVGSAVKGVGDYLQGAGLLPTGIRELAKNAVPITGQLELPALAARVGELVPKARAFGSKASGSIARSADEEIIKNLAKHNASEIGLEAMTQGNRQALKTSSFFGRLSDKLNAAGFVPEAEETLAQRGARAINNLGGAAEKAPVQGVRPANVKETVQNLATQFAPGLKGSASSLGGALETANTLGKGVQSVNETVVKGGLKATSALGGTIKNTGKFVKDTGTLLEPLENRLWLQQGLQYGSEEMPSYRQKLQHAKQMRFTQ